LEQAARVSSVGWLGAVGDGVGVHAHRAGEVSAVGEAVAVVVDAVGAGGEVALGLGAGLDAAQSGVVAVDGAVAVVVLAVGAGVGGVLGADGDEDAARQPKSAQSAKPLPSLSLPSSQVSSVFSRRQQVSGIVRQLGSPQSHWPSSSLSI
jgi:hypothetical protein